MHRMEVMSEDRGGVQIILVAYVPRMRNNFFYYNT
ncbi:hypothetical protein Lepto7375DRAFT_0048 [Leptolyngbya sp. PCC 7375]|nr:hypothetical protein Lepto7375DRAFT_0048 [Leptolyngbya sp. PCC 7375]